MDLTMRLAKSRDFAKPPELCDNKQILKVRS
jgi:hypothetical protein